MLSCDGCIWLVVGLLYVSGSATYYVIIHGHHTCIHILCYYIHLLLCCICIAHITHNIVHAVHLSYKVTRSRLLTKVDHEFATYVIINLGEALTLLNIPVSSLLHQ